MRKKERLNKREIRVDKHIKNLLAKIQNYFGINSLSETIRLILSICIWNYSDSEEDTEEYSTLEKKIITKVSIIRPSKTELLPFRISDSLLNEAQTIYPTSNPKDKKGITYTILHCIAEFCTRIISVRKSLPPHNSELLKKGECLFNRPGVKKEKLLGIILNTIEELRMKHNCDTFIEPFAGTANVTLHLKTRFKTEWLNDGEYDIASLLSILQKRSNRFMMLLLCIPVNRKIFNILEKELSKKANNSEIGKDIVRAVKYYYYTHIVKVTYNKKKQKIVYSYNSENAKKQINLITLKKISYRLKGVIITQKDVFEFLNELLKRKGSLDNIIIYLDPPYIGTEGYYKRYNKKDKTFHQKLQELILELKGRGAHIILSYRATVTDNNGYTSTPEVQSKLDELYMNKGFFIQFQKVNIYSIIQIEILLTSEQVKGSIPYDRNIADLIKNM